jgi:hypothetical protein
MLKFDEQLQTLSNKIQNQLKMRKKYELKLTE